MKYIIGTGYCGDKADLLSRWIRNTREYTSTEKIVVVTPEDISNIKDADEILFIPVGANLGHVHAPACKGPLYGWSMSVMMSCLFAYHNNCDLIYKEQDCFAFGPWVKDLYSHNTPMVIGGLNKGEPCDGFRAQSLFLIKYDALLPFVHFYTGLDSDDATMIPEYKFDLYMRAHPSLVAETSMGYDRTRPYDKEKTPFYVQQCTPAEMEDLNV